MAHELHTDIEIDAAPETVWTILTDLEAYASWNPFIISADGDVEVGARLVNRLAPPDGREMTFKPKVTEVVEGRVFEWLGRLVAPGLFDGRHRFELVPTERGTRVLHSEHFTGLLVPLIMPRIADGTAAGFEAMNEALRVRAEAQERVG